MNTIKKIAKYGLLRSFYLILPTLRTKRYIKKRKQMFKQNGELVLKHVVEVLTRNSIKYWLEYGTLLGIVRDGKLIDGDLDLDIGVFTPENKNIYKEILEAEGCTRLKIWLIDDEVIEETYVYKGVHFDLYYFKREGNKLFTYTCYKDNVNQPINLNKYNLIKYSYDGYSSFINYQFNGFSIVIPENYDLVLTQKYGDWRVRNPNWTIFDSPVVEKLDQYATLLREKHCKSYQ